MTQPPRAKTVFILQHSYVLDDCDETKMIGVYSTADAAEEAKKRLLTQPGFKEHPDDFTLESYELNVDHWTEGFITDRH